jgi:hypothetical protein
VDRVPTARVELSTDRFGSSISNVLDDEGEHVTVENRDFFLEHPLSVAVRKEVRGLVDLSDADIAWLVEATLWQLQRLAKRSGAVDLDYLGQIVSIDGSARDARTGGRPALVWHQRTPMEAMNRVLSEAARLADGGDHGA